jgi:predicted CoA-binding protein
MTIVVLGAGSNPNRYSFLAAERLQQHGYHVVPVGYHGGLCAGLSIQTDFAHIANVHTITLYVSLHRQPYWHDFIFKLKPKRLIFNPGTENENLQQLAKDLGIEVVDGCTLVMLGSGTF